MVVETAQPLPVEALADGHFKDVQQVQIALRHEAERLALRLRPAGAADAVHVVLGIDREIVVHHVGHAVDVDAAGDDVGGDEDLDFSVLEVLERLEPLFLRAAGVEAGDLHAGEFEEIGEQVRAVLHADEDEHPGEPRLAEEFQQK